MTVPSRACRRKVRTARQMKAARLFDEAGRRRNAEAGAVLDRNGNDVSALGFRLVMARWDRRRDRIWRLLREANLEAGDDPRRTLHG